MVDQARHGDAHALIGRERELGLIGEFLDRSASEGEALLLLGEAGMGKSVLLDAAADEARDRGHRVLRASGVEFEPDVSYTGLGQALLPLIAEIPALSPTHRDALTAALGFADGSPERLVVSNAMLALLNRAARVDPVLMVVDDVPWLDRATAAVFGFVARRLAGSRVGFLAGSRIGEPGFFESAGLPDYELGPLDRASAVSLLKNRFPGLAARVRDRVLTEARGNPLAILEFPAALTDDQRAGRAPLPAVLPVRNRLRRLFEARIQGLPSDTRQLLLIAALHSSGDLRELSALEAGGGLEALVPAEQAALVNVDHQARRIVFRHPLVRAAVVEIAPSQQRRDAHRLLAATLVDQPDRQAWHLADASSEPDEMVASLLEQTAWRMVARGDAVAAVTALTRAADLSPAASDRSRRLVHAASIGGEVTGDLLNVTRILEEARLGDVEESLSLDAAAAAAWVVLTLDGNIDTAHRLLVAAIELQGDQPPVHDATFENALYTLEIICYFGGRAELWAAFDNILARLGPNVPYLLDIYSRTSADPARTTPSSLRELDALVDRLSEEANPAQIIRVSLTGAFLDRLAYCRAPLWRVVDDGRAGGAIASEIVALVVLAEDDFVCGQWDEVLQLAAETLVLCEEHGYGLQKWSALHVQALVAAGRGDYDTARVLADEMFQWAAPRQVGTVMNFARHASGLAALGRGDYEEAFQQADAISPAGTLRIARAASSVGTA